MSTTTAVMAASTVPFRTAGAAAILVPSRGSDAHRLERDAAEARDRARQLLAAERGRYEGSRFQDFVRQLKVHDLTTWTTVFGSALLWSVLPLLILLSSLANERIDDDLGRHIGVSGQGVVVVRALFRNSPTFSSVRILTWLLFAVVGSVTVVASIRVLYERAFERHHRGGATSPVSSPGWPSSWEP